MWQLCRVGTSFFFLVLWLFLIYSPKDWVAKLSVYLKHILILILHLMITIWKFPVIIWCVLTILQTINEEVFVYIINIFLPLRILNVQYLQECITAKNTVISPNFLVWKLCGKTQFPHSFGRFARKLVTKPVTLYLFIDLPVKL